MSFFIPSLNTLYHSFLSYSPDISVTYWPCDLHLWPFNPKTIHFLGYPRVIPYTKFEHFGLFRSSHKQTDKWTDGLEHPTSCWPTLSVRVMTINQATHGEWLLCHRPALAPRCWNNDKTNKVSGRTHAWLAGTGWVEFVYVEWYSDSQSPTATHTCTNLYVSFMSNGDKTHTSPPIAGWYQNHHSVASA